MKKTLFIALVAMLMVAMPSKAEIKFGVRGGLNITNLTCSASDLSKDNRTGFYLGPTVKIGLPLGFDVDASLLYDQREFVIDSDTQTKKAIDLQANIRKGMGLGDKASLFFFAGPQFAFNVGGKNLFKKDSYDWTWNSSDFSVNVGVGAVVLNHVEVKVNYNIACGKTADANVWDSTKQAFNNAVSPKTNAWQIGVAYYF